MARVPLGFRILVHDKRRFLWALLGVSCAVLLMFVQVGFMKGQDDSVTLLLSRLDADLLMINRIKHDVTPTSTFPLARLQQALRFPGVAAAYPVYLRLDVEWRDARGGAAHPMRVIAYHPGDPVWVDADINRRSPELRLPETCWLDRRSRAGGRIEPGRYGELSGRRMKVLGGFELGPDMVVDGTLVTAATTFESYLGEPGLDQVELGLIRLAPEADRERVAALLRQELLGDVTVLAKLELIRRIHDFWHLNYPSGAIFSLGVTVGFLIGIMICYQILFTEIADHLPQYATLKAIGYGNGYLVATVLRQAVYLSLSAFALGTLLSFAAYRLLQSLTGLQMWLTPGRLGLVLVLTVLMCVVAGLVAVRRALSVDPAEVF